MKIENNSKKIRGFTLIELLMVVAIIGLLSSVVLASLNSARTKAKYAKGKTDIKQITLLVEVAKGQSGKHFGEITGSYCTECACRGKGNVQLLPKSDSCWTTSDSAISLLNTAAGGVVKFRSGVSDPWGGPYLFNENENEGGTCYTDNILSAGPNGIYYDSDDIVYNLPVINCSPALGSHHPNVNF